MFSSCPSVHLLTSLYDMISLYLVEDFSETCDKYSSCVEKILRDQRSRSLGLHLWELCEWDISLIMRGILVKSFSTADSITACVQMCKCYMAETYILMMWH